MRKRNKHAIKAENSLTVYREFLLIVDGMGNEEGEKGEDQEENKKSRGLSRKDSVALFIAALESLLLPVIILAIILLIVAVLLFVLFAGR